MNGNSCERLILRPKDILTWFNLTPKNWDVNYFPKPQSSADEKHDDCDSNDSSRPDLIAAGHSCVVVKYLLVHVQVI